MSKPFIFRNGTLLNVVFIRMDHLPQLLCNSMKVGAMGEFVGLIFVVLKHSVAYHHLNTHTPRTGMGLS